MYLWLALATAVATSVPRCLDTVVVVLTRYCRLFFPHRSPSRLKILLSIKVYNILNHGHRQQYNYYVHRSFYQSFYAFDRRRPRFLFVSSNTCVWYLLFALYKTPHILLVLFLILLYPINHLLCIHRQIVVFIIFCVIYQRTLRTRYLI